MEIISGQEFVITLMFRKYYLEEKKFSQSLNQSLCHGNPADRCAKSSAGSREVNWRAADSSKLYPATYLCFSKREYIMAFCKICGKFPDTEAFSYNMLKFHTHNVRTNPEPCTERGPPTDTRPYL